MAEMKKAGIDAGYIEQFSLPEYNQLIL